MNKDSRMRLIRPRYQEAFLVKEAHPYSCFEVLPLGMIWGSPETRRSIGRGLRLGEPVYREVWRRRYLFLLRLYEVLEREGWTGDRAIQEPGLIQGLKESVRRQLEGEDLHESFEAWWDRVEANVSFLPVPTEWEIRFALWVPLQLQRARGKLPAELEALLGAEGWWRFGEEAMVPWGRKGLGVGSEPGRVEIDIDRALFKDRRTLVADFVVLAALRKGTAGQRGYVLENLTACHLTFGPERYLFREFESHLSLFGRVREDQIEDHIEELPEEEPDRVRGLPSREATRRLWEFVGMLKPTWRQVRKAVRMRKWVRKTFWWYW